MPKLLYTWYFEKFTASVTSSYHSALRHEVSRICTILLTMVSDNICRGQEPCIRANGKWVRAIEFFFFLNI